MESPQDKLIRYIQDAHASEVGIVVVLKDFIDEVKDPQVRAIFQEHLQVTQTQADRLEQRLIALGSGTSDGKGFLNQVMGKLGDMMHASHDTEDKTTQDLIKAYATENLEIGMYEALISYSEALGDQTTAQLARQIQAEEQEAAQKVFPLISSTARLPLAKAAQPV
jgi:ferritin-like metal-binding protein YciE